MPSNIRIREWLSLVGALGIGPLALMFGYSQRYMFGVAAFYYFLVCAMAVPLLIYSGGRLKFLVWQLAVLDLALSVVGDGIRLGIRLHAGEIISEAYVFWAMGILLSSPIPIYFILRPLSRRRRFIIGFAIALIAAALLIGATVVAR